MTDPIIAAMGCWCGAERPCAAHDTPAIPEGPPPPAPFSENTEVTIEWETGARYYVQIDGFDVVILDFIHDSDTVNVQVWDRLHGKNPEVAARVDVKFHD